MKRWTFGEFVLDLDRRELGRHGTPVPLSPKALQLLGVLVENYPRAISRAELQDCLWPGTFVVEKNLTNLVGEIRHALGDDPEDPRFIRTVHRFGYAFREAPAVDAHAPGGDAARRHNLPVPLTNFIGRGPELAELSRLAASTRLLTLTGSGGCGKTRLALKVAAAILDRFADGAWVVDLAALSDPTLVSQTVAATLDVREGPNRSIDEALTQYVGNREMLLVLDNCEHLIAASARLADALLRASQRLSILATSREGLGITGETVWRVPSLSFPEPSELSPSEDLLEYDAVRLFVERAKAVHSGFTVTPESVSMIAQVCRRLDGIPLAIELAAARVNLLSIDQIEARLNDRFRLLTGGSRTALARQRTLKAAVDWSYDLLSDSERQFLRRLSVFAGGWTLESAEQVTSDGSRKSEDALDLLSRLVDKSLVTVDGDSDETRRYRYLETVRQYAQDRLLESGEANRFRDRQLTFFYELVLRAEPELTGPAQVSWLNRLHREHDNLRLALDWCLAAPDRSEQSVELAAALFWFWLKRGYLREGQEWLDRALSADDDPPARLRAKALMSLGCITFFRGDFVRAQMLLEQSEMLGRTVGDLSVVAFSLGMRAICSLELGDIVQGVRIATESEAAARSSTNPWMQAPALSCLAYLAMHEGDFDRAGRLHEQALELCRERGEKWGMGISLFDLALLRVVQQRHAEARALCGEGLVLYQEFGDRRGIAWCLGVLSGAEAADGDALRAARLRGAMEGLLDSVGAPIQTSYNQWIGDRYSDVMKERLGESTFQAALIEGRNMSLSRAVQLALQNGSRELS